ncbi:ATP-binding protein [Paenibacillus sp. 32352]|uniref:ATP-binding protein n=1 Tax=Paenibacillus sp. 32352 TaxID=1969111 RepID=UPI0009ABCBF8
MRGIKSSPLSTRLKKQAWGLGLPICQRIVNSHGGYIEITRSSEEGTEIRVTLPKVCYERIVSG